MGSKNELETELKARLGTSPYTGELSFVHVLIGPQLLAAIDKAPRPTRPEDPDNPDSKRVPSERAHFSIADGAFVEPSAQRLPSTLITLFLNPNTNKYDLVRPSQPSQEAAKQTNGQVIPFQRRPKRTIHAPPLAAAGR